MPCVRVFERLACACEDIARILLVGWIARWVCRLTPMIVITINRPNRTWPSTYNAIFHATSSESRKDKRASQWKFHGGCWFWNDHAEQGWLPAMLMAMSFPRMHHLLPRVLSIFEAKIVLGTNQLANIRSHLKENNTKIPRRAKNQVAFPTDSYTCMVHARIDLRGGLGQCSIERHLLRLLGKNIKIKLHTRFPTMRKWHAMHFFHQHD